MKSPVSNEPVRVIVVGCTHLSIRSRPLLSSDVIYISKAGDGLTLKKLYGVSAWARVCTANGVTGYTRKEFIKEV